MGVAGWQQQCTDDNNDDVISFASSFHLLAFCNCPGGTHSTGGDSDSCRPYRRSRRAWSRPCCRLQWRQWTSWFRRLWRLWEEQESEEDAVDEEEEEEDIEEEEKEGEEEIPVIEEDFNVDQYDEEAELVPTDIDETTNDVDQSENEIEREDKAAFDGTDATASVEDIF